MAEETQNPTSDEPTDAATPDTTDATATDTPQAADAAVTDTPEASDTDAADMATEALAATEKAVDDLARQTEGAAEGDDTSADGPNVDLPNFQQVLADVNAGGIELLHDVELNVKIELGRTHMLVEDVLRLAEGSVVELNKLAGDPVDVYVNNRLVARGEVLVLNENFCVRISEVIAENDLEEVEEDDDETSSLPETPEE